MKYPHARSRKFLLLDRDGVLNENRPDYVKNMREVRFYPEALESVKLLHQKGVSIILISNQSGVGRGFIQWDHFWEMHDGFIRKIEDSGGEILAAFYCPHRPDEHCLCRKPLPGMLLNACRIYGIQPRDTAFIGDQGTDVLAARKTGCAAIRICRGMDGKAPDDCMETDTPVFDTLLDAVHGLYV